MANIDLQRLINNVLDMVRDSQDPDSEFNRKKRTQASLDAWDKNQAAIDARKQLIRGELDKQTLVNEGNLGVQRLRNTGESDVQGLRNTGELARQRLVNETEMGKANIESDWRRHGTDVGLVAEKYRADQGLEGSKYLAGVKGDPLMAYLRNPNADLSPEGIRTFTNSLKTPPGNDIRTFDQPEKSPSPVATEEAPAPNIIRPQEKLVPKTRLQTSQQVNDESVAPAKKKPRIRTLDEQQKDWDKNNLTAFGTVSPFSLTVSPKRAALLKKQEDEELKRMNESVKNYKPRSILFGY